MTGFNNFVQVTDTPHPKLNTAKFIPFTYLKPKVNVKNHKWKCGNIMHGSASTASFEMLTYMFTSIAGMLQIKSRHLCAPPNCF